MLSRTRNAKRRLGHGGGRAGAGRAYTYNPMSPAHSSSTSQRCLIGAVLVWERGRKEGKGLVWGLRDRKGEEGGIREDWDESGAGFQRLHMQYDAHVPVSRQYLRAIINN